MIRFTIAILIALTVAGCLSPHANSPNVERESVNLLKESAERCGWQWDAKPFRELARIHTLNEFSEIKQDIMGKPFEVQHPQYTPSQQFDSMLAGSNIQVNRMELGHIVHFRVDQNGILEFTGVRDITNRVRSNP